MPGNAIFEPLESRQLLAAFTVTNTNDAGAGSLRQAVLDANAAPGADVIQFSAGVTGTISLSTGELSVSESLTIDGPGANVLSVSAGGRSRVFNFTAGTSFLRRLWITGGNASSGGGVVNAGTLTVENCEVSVNSAGSGGGIANTGTLTLLASTISYNTSTTSGAGLFNASAATMLVINSTISNNTTTGQYGGGIDTLGTLTVTNSTIAGNSAATGGRGISIRSGGIATAISTIVARNNKDVFGTFEPGSTNNLVQDSTSSGGLTNNVHGNIVGLDPMLDELGWRGGATRSRTLRATSPAINKGANPEALTTDQRGGIYARQVGTAADIGAFEFGGDDYANSDQWAFANEITLNVAGHGLALGSLEQQYDTDLFSFVPTSSGSVSITLVVTPRYDGLFAVYNSAHNLVGVTNSFASGHNETGSYTLTSGQTYFLVVSGWPFYDGAYSVLISDDHADAGNWSNASVIALNATADGSRTGSIESVNDTDLFKFTPSITGAATVALNVSSGFDGWFEIYATDHTLIARRNVAATGGRESLSLQTVSGQTYFVLVGGWRNPSGSYSIQIDDDYADAGDWSRAVGITINSSLDGSRAGVIGTAWDTDLFTFTPASSGTLTITLDVGAGFDGWFQILAATHSLLRSQNLKAAGGDETYAFAVTAAQTYYILVGGWRVPNGDYTIRISDDRADAGDWASAREIPINGSLDGLLYGTIESQGDTDLFRFTSPVSGNLNVTLDVGTGFDGWFEVYNAAHALLFRQSLWAAGGDETRTFAVATGQTYFILVGGWRVPSGDYRILIADDHADAGYWSFASEISLSASVDGSLPGQIESPGDTDLFRFTPSTTASATILLSDGAGFDGWFEVYDTSQMLLLRKNLWGSGTDEIGSVTVAAGMPYYILVGGWRVPNGSYTIRISDDHADAGAWASATVMTPDEDLYASQNGKLEAAGDTDLFGYTPSISGVVTITLDVVRGFDGWFEVYDANHVLMGRQNLRAGDGDEIGTFNLIEGQSYFILVGGWLVPNGRYGLSVSV